MKRINLISKFIMLTIALVCFNNFVAAASENFVPGTYLSSGEIHKIEIKEDNTVLYKDNYSLTINKNVKGSSLTGKIGTNAKNVTFFKINDTTLLSSERVTYTHNGQTEYLYEYTPFRMNSNLNNIDLNGAFELYSGDERLNVYADLQSAIDAAKNHNTIKINKAVEINEGVYVGGKSITIDGSNNTLNRANWTNAVIVIDEDATLNLKNVVIDGGASGFAINYDGANYNNGSIPFVSNSATNDPQQKVSAIVSMGNLITDNVVIKNNYTVSSGAALYVVSGNVTLKNSTFDHNRTTYGGAMYAGSALRTGQTTNPVSKISIIDTEFKRNYAAAGGAITFYNVKEVEINNSEFNSNTVKQNGGAIYVQKSYKAIMDTYNMDFVQIKIMDTLFENNWAGNDGIVLENEDGEFTIINTIFRKNIGVNQKGSRATFSNPLSRGSNWAYQYIKNCLFEENKGEISCIWDNGTKTTITVEDTNFVGNIGKKSVLYSTAVTSYTNCLFSGENVQDAIITFAPNDTSAWYEGSGYTEPNILIKDTKFTNLNKDTDVAIATEGGANDELVKANVVFDGNSEANVYLQDGNSVTLKGNFSGNVVVDYKTDIENVIVDENVTINGLIIDRNLYVEYENGTGEKFAEQILIETDKKVSPWYMQCFLDVWKDGYALYFYTDKNYQNAWDYVVKDGADLFARWEEHTHSFDGILNENTGIISEICDCGCPFERLKVIVPQTFEYDGNKKEFLVEYISGESFEEYELTHYKKVNDAWEELQEAPLGIGNYKVKISYDVNLMNIANNIVIEYEYNISKAKLNIKLNNLTQYYGSISPVTYTVNPEITDGVLKIEYKAAGDNTEYSENVPDTIGNHKLRVTLTGDSNIEDFEKEFDFAIRLKSSSKTRYEIKVIENFGGNVTPNTTRVSKGSNRTFKIKADEGFEIEDVLVDGKSIGIVQECVFEKVTTKHTLEVKFKEIKKDIPWKNPFKDVKEKDWFYNAVKYINQKGLMNGIKVDEFAPNLEMTRGMLVTILWRLEKEPVVNYYMQFEDVDQTSYYGEAVRWAASEKIVKGMTSKEFDPNGNVTREQLVTILHRYAQRIKRDVSVGENTNILSYEDYDELYEYAIPAMQWACGDGIIQGRTESTLNPKDTASRAEIATIIMRFIEK